jgi:hypothetical protein
MTVTSFTVMIFNNRKVSCEKDIIGWRVCGGFIILKGIGMKNTLKSIILLSVVALLCACNSKTVVAPSEQSNQTVSAIEQSKVNISSNQQQNQNSDPNHLEANQTNINQQNQQSAKSGATIDSLIPEGWHILAKSKGKPEQAIGDLNKDGIDDFAIAIEGESKAKEAPPRALMIAFGKGDNQYSLSIIADKAILKADEGGVWGDPLEGISIDRGSVLISFYGGSNDRWYAKYRFRFQDHDWYLIGATLGSYFTGTMTQENGNEEDYNLLTGDYSIRKVDENDASNSKTTKGNRGKTTLLKLKDFDASGAQDQFLK